MPTKTQQDYTKKKKIITRVDLEKLEIILTMVTLEGECRAIIERPMVNPKMFKATGSALRALESVLIACEHLVIPIEFIDSKQWQRVMLPNGTKGTPELKKASRDIGIRMFPQFKNLILKQKDADGLLIAEWGRRVLNH